MILLDTFLRGGSIWVLASVGLVLISQSKTRQSGWLIFAYAITIGSFLIKSAPIASDLPIWLLWLTKILATVSYLPMAKITTDIFLDHKHDSHPILALGLLASMAALTNLFFPVFDNVRLAMMLVFFVVIFYITLRSAKGDLVAKRRLFRPVLIGLACCLGVFVAVSQLLSLPDSAIIYLFQSATFLALNLAFAFMLSAPMQGVWLADTDQPKQSPPIVSAHSPQLAQRLEAAMQDGIWRQEHLTIRDLASQIGAREHHLRALINKDLGFRNFSAFINTYRIEAAKEALVARQDISILEVAYDCGFASLAPFNKAFRAQTDLSPSEYRQHIPLAD